MTTKTLTLFHVNDLHSYFDNWPHIVGHVNQNRDQNTLFIDLGDHADRSHLITEATEGKGNIELLNEAKVDYATIGNNEGVTFSKKQLEHLYDDATFQVLVGNLFEQDGSTPTWAKPYVIHTMENGLKVGLIGWTAPFSRLYSQLGWRSESDLEPLYELIKLVREKVDILVLMSHLGLFRDEEIAEKVEGIDVILGSHTHDLLKQGKRIYGTLITQSGKHGHYFGKVLIEYDTKKKQVVSSVSELIEASSTKASKQTSTLIDRLNKQSFHTLDETVATLPTDFPVSWQENTEIVQMLCDALAQWCNEDIAMLNAGILLESLPAGKVTKGDIHRICPHPINPCVVEMTGKQLRQAIERSFTKEIRFLQLKGFGFRGKLIGRMIFTGIEVSLDVNEENVLSIKILNEPLQETNMYRVATLDMYTFGHLYPSIYEAPNKKYFMPEFLRDILAWKLGQEWA
ncbi:nuclease [Bacillus sp. TS-2]|nr:nuclease [Bacillus sp. TS-2]